MWKVRALAIKTVSSVLSLHANANIAKILLGDSYLSRGM